jgi:hypothetical protein
VTIEGIDAMIDVRGGRPVVVARARLRSLSSQPMAAGLALAAGETSVPVEGFAAGATRTVELVLDTDAAAALGPSTSGQLELRAPDGKFWLRRGWHVETPMSKAVALVASLANPADAVAPLGARLRAELKAALADPKAFKQSSDDSELAQYAAALSSLPAAARELLSREVSAPLLQAAEGQDVPRSIRKAVRGALEGS